MVIIVLCTLAGGGYWYWKQARAGQQVTDNRPSFEAPLTSSLELSAGQGTATYSRSDGADHRATLTDFEGIIRSAKDGEARFEGVRRVENLLLKSETYDGTSWPTQSALSITTGIADPLGGTSAVRIASTGANGYMDSATVVSSEARVYRFTVWVRNPGTDPSSTLRMVLLANGSIISGSDYQTNSVPSAWTRYSIIGTAPALTTTLAMRMWGGSYFATGETLDLAFPMFEEVTGQANQNPSEYVSMNVKTAFPYHGAGVDGVKYFPTQNGNTVTGNIVTDAQGNAIPDATMYGYKAEGVRTNLLLQSESFGTSWTSDDGSIASDVAVAPDGRLTADKFVSNTNAAQHRVKQTLTFTAATTYTGTVYVKKAGYDYHMKIWSAGGFAGVSVNLDTGGVISTTGTEYVSSSVASLPNSWYRVSLTLTTVSGGSYVMMNYLYNGAESFTGDGTSGVYLWGAQLEQANFTSSYIPTTTTSVARGGDLLSYPTTGNISEQAFSTSMEFVRWNNVSGGSAYRAPLAIGTYNVNANVVIGNYSATIVSTLANFGSTWSLNTSAGTLTYGVPLRVGFRLDNDLQTTATFKNGVKYTTSNVASSAKSSSWAGSPSRIFIGSAGTSSPDQNITIKKVNIWKHALSDTELQNITNTNDTVANSAVKKTTVNVSENTLFANGLVGLWSFNGADISGVSAYDRSGQGNNGTLTNGPTVTPGRIGQALSFNGANNVIIGTATTYRFTAEDFTISAWAKTSVGYVSQGSGVNAIIGRGFTTTSGSYGLFINNANKPTFNIEGNSVVGNMTIHDGQWHHLVGVRTGSVSQLWVDGVLAGTGAAANLTSNSVSLGIGADDSGGIRFFNGTIDEARIYNRALSGTEIWNLYQAGGGTKANSADSQTDALERGLAGYWKLDDASGTTATDASTNGSNGTLTSGPTWTTGQIGGAVSFDGTDDYIIEAGTTQYKFTSSFAFGGWFQSTGDQDNRPVAGFDSGSNYRYSLVIDNVGAESFQCQARLTGGLITASFTMTVVTNDWYHLYCSYDDSLKVVTLYVNGTKAASSSVGSGSLTDGGAGQQKFSIGRSQGSSPSYWTGIIDEMRMYNRAFSPEEVAKLYKSTAPDNPDTGLKGYWSLNGPDVSGTTVYDRSGIGNNGTMSGSPTVTPGKNGQALKFDGSSYVSGVAPALSVPVTISAWYKIDPNSTLYTNTAKNETIAMLRSGSANYEAFIIRITNTSLNILRAVVCSLDNTSGTCQSATGTTNLWGNDGWIHVVGVFASNTSRTVYVNGVSEGTDTISKDVQTTTLYAGVGTSSTTLQHYAEGSIDDIRVYNRTLSDSEIATLYNIGR